MARGRPRAEINLALVESLAQIGCTQEEICAVVGCSVKTLRKHAKQEIAEGGEKMKVSLRRWQYAKAKEGNVAMLIWMGKQYLGQRDRIDETRREEVITIEPIEIMTPRLATA